ASKSRSRYNVRVPNRAYLKIWCREVTAETFPKLLLAFLETVPFSLTRRGFTQLALRAIETSETPLMEFDLRAAPATPEGVLELLGESLREDSSVELEAWWDLWVFDAASGEWTSAPQRLELIAYGPEFEDGAWRQTGHFSVDLGFEHMFTGHAGLLGSPETPGAADSAAPEDPDEADFVRRMSQPDALREYAERTRENIRRLQAWVQQIAQALPLDPGTGIELGSEGEEDFEARLDAIETGS
ncbi:MAG TPA: hypothetical protein VKG84_06665, partial [Candidatus Acidoferrales bacterium]|nr:hypothetical protein [Candidatus Acidoferrales bacterium]